MHKFTKNIICGEALEIKPFWDVPIGIWLVMLIHWANLACDITYLLTVPWDQEYLLEISFAFLCISHGLFICFVVLMLIKSLICCVATVEQSSIVMLNSWLGSMRIYEIYENSKTLRTFRPDTRT